MSLSPNGMPCSGPRCWPPAISASAFRACRRARSNVGVMKARVCASKRSTRWISASVSSTGESLRAAISPESSAIERSCRSVAMGFSLWGPSIALTPSPALATLGPTPKGETTMAFMTKDGFRLYYEDSGGNAPAIVFLHGAGGNHLSWWQQLPVFADEYRCIAVDQRGFGQSPDVPGGPGPAALGADVLALLDHLGIARAALVAQSMGGWAAVGAAVRAPERFWAVVLANTVGNLSNDAIAAVRQRLGAASPPRPAVIWHAALGATFRKREPIRSFLYAQISGLNAPLSADFRDQLMRLTTPVERYAATRVPTMFLTSDEDGLIWPELSETVHAHVPGSESLRVPMAGHSTYFERPDVFNREVGAFLKTHRP